VTRLRQILVNLLGNAVKFTEQGEVALDVKLASREHNKLGLHFSVRDTGLGIPKEKQQLIFEAFTQVDGSTTRRFGGTGLGLTISARLVKAMNGEIWVDSEPGKGSTFHFTATLGVASESLRAPSKDAAALEGLRVLVVDDNRTNRRILTATLRSWGMEAAGAESAQDALEYMRRGAQLHQPIQLVLTDVHMPEMDGFELVERIQATPNLTNAFILMLTSGEHMGDLARCRELGVSAFLTKPIRRGELWAGVVAAAAGRGRDSEIVEDLRVLAGKTAQPA
jgi:CheY-like chemotaxis protein